MEEKFELLECVYKDAEMGSYTTEELLKDLKEADNKIKDTIEDILKEYQSFSKEVMSLLKKHQFPQDKNGLMSKMGAKMGIMKEVKADNSDASIADMLIKGMSMGSIDMEKKIRDYEKEADKESVNIAKSFLEFQQNAISKLKKYL